MPRTASKAASSAEELQVWNELNAQLILISYLVLDSSLAQHIIDTDIAIAHMQA